MKAFESKLAVLIALSGWGLLTVYLYSDYLHSKPDFFIRLIYPADYSQAVFQILIFLSPLITTVVGYAVNYRISVSRRVSKLEEEYRDLYENAPDGYFSVSPVGSIMQANQAFLKMTGYRGEEIIGKNAAEIFSKGEDRMKFDSLRTGECDKTRTEGIEFEMRRKDGSLLPVAMNFKASCSPGGKIESIRAIAKDITEIKDRETKLVRSRAAYFNMLKDLDSTVKDLRLLSKNLILSFANAIDAKSQWTKGHSERVTLYSVAISKEMGIGGKDIENLRTAALLHDIGKIGTYDIVLDKPGRLTEEEFELVKKHPAKGVEILAPIKELAGILPLVRHHHERMDGRGYPDGLRGDEIPILARALCVADSFDSMTADRPYRKAMTVGLAVEELRRCSGTQFDPEAVKAFLRLISRGEMATIREEAVEAL